MSNSQASGVPYFNPGSFGVSATDIPDSQRSRPGRRNLALGLAAVAITAVVVGGLQYVRVSEAPDDVAPITSNLVTGVQLEDTYGVGSSVYNEQVPPEAGTDLSGYQPGGSVYDQQVPQP